ELAHEEVVEFERELTRDVSVGTLLVRQADVKTDGPAVRFGGSAVRRLHDASAASGAYDELLSIVRHRLGPLGTEPRQLARLRVVSPERSVFAQSRRTEEDDRVVDALLLEAAQGL